MTVSVKGLGVYRVDDQGKIFVVKEKFKSMDEVDEDYRDIIMERLFSVVSQLKLGRVAFYGIFAEVEKHYSLIKSGKSILTYPWTSSVRVNGQPVCQFDLVLNFKRSLRFGNLESITVGCLLLGYHGGDRDERMREFVNVGLLSSVKERITTSKLEKITMYIYPGYLLGCIGDLIGKKWHELYGECSGL
jgi:hypothetical protein